MSSSATKCFRRIFDIHSPTRIPVRGVFHVMDVSDINNPRKVAEYPVPEGGAHNMWVENDMMYVGYYSGGGRIVDVSGELRGDLYKQGREIARIWTGRSERLPAKHAVHVGRATAQRFDLLQRCQLGIVDREARGEDR